MSLNKIKKVVDKKKKNKKVQCRPTLSLTNLESGHTHKHFPSKLERQRPKLKSFVMMRRRLENQSMVVVSFVRHDKHHRIVQCTLHMLTRRTPSYTATLVISPAIIYHHRVQFEFINNHESTQLAFVYFIF